MDSLRTSRWPAVFSLFLIGHLSLYAQDKIWQGPAGTSSWFVPENWTPNLPPTNTERAVIDTFPGFLHVRGECVEHRLLVGFVRLLVA